MGVGDDVLLLAVEHLTGQPQSRQKSGVALAAAHLVEWALDGQIRLDGMHLEVVDKAAATASGDGFLKELAESNRRMTVASWLRSHAMGMAAHYLGRLRDQHVLAELPIRRREKYPRFQTVDQSARIRAAARFTALANSEAAEADVDPADLAFALLVDGLGLDAGSLRGLFHRRAKARLVWLADLPRREQEPDRIVQVIVRVARQVIPQGRDPILDGPVPLNNYESTGLPFVGGGP